MFTTAGRVRSLRNRAAHHEPLMDGGPLPGRPDHRGRARRLTLPDAHTEVLRPVEHIDKDVAARLGRTSRVPELLRTRPWTGLSAREVGPAGSARCAERGSQR